ncbi:MAG: DUF4112 domain-containing protein [Leptolyngbyaceae cyanobacterium RM1_406_9]|nr:DUF4112 domain-containing protein [Leptolyngbyaceae cyanobacterium RM1_406_9]
MLSRGERSDFRWHGASSAASQRPRATRRPLLWQKKRHTRKHITGSTRKKRVILLTKARGGKVHDKRQLDEEDLVGNILDEVAIEGDLGFQGLQNEFDNVHPPHKKPRGKELSEQQKQENREFSRQRVKCEYAHAGIKRYRSVTDVYRNRIPDFDDRLMLNAAGLWNLYLDVAYGQRNWKTLPQSEFISQQLCLLGPIGLDAVIGVVPIAGDLYTVLAGSWLFILARRVNAPLGDLLLLVALSGIDLIIGLVPVDGDILDAFFRIHAWFGGRLITHVNMHLSLIENARFQIGQDQDFDLIALRSSLFRKS